MLFSGMSSQDALGGLEREMFAEIDGIEGNTLLNTSVNDQCEYFFSKYKIDPLQLLDVTVDQKEVDCKLSHQELPLDTSDSRGEPPKVKGTAVSFFIAFAGDHQLFSYRPSGCDGPLPSAEVRQGQLVLTYHRADHDSVAVRAQFDLDHAALYRCVSSQFEEVQAYNAGLPWKIRDRIENRRLKLLNDQSMVGSLGFPLRRRADAPQTYAVPSIRRKVVPVRPSAAPTPFQPEPALAMEVYEHILSVISNMTAVIERSPHAFREMKEEDIRQHFLVQLNGQYEGQATGETFNYEGKTDILIREKGKNIFIAECKFWEGQKALKDAIDQLLGYTSWRDTKTALLVFNRNRDFSAVLAKMKEAVLAHPNCKRQLAYPSETGSRYLFSHRDDINREIILTVLAFEVPT